MTSTAPAILRIELWHGLLVIGLLAILGPMRAIEPSALLLGGLFMGVNFFLLGYGVQSILTPLAGKGRIRAGVSLLVLKIAIFLGLLTTLFFRLDLDAISFAMGFSTLPLAIVFETLRMARSAG